MTRQFRKEVEQEAQSMLRGALAESTWKGYSSVSRQFFLFRQGWEEMEGPCSIPQLIVLFLATKRTEGLSTRSTIN